MGAVLDNADMAETRKGFLERLQSLPDAEKKRVLVIAAAVIMALIVYFWLAYFNNLIAVLSRQSAAPVADSGPAQGVAQSAPRESFGDMIDGGLGLIYKEFGDLARGMGGFVSSPGQYDIQPQK